METFSALLAFLQGIHRSPVNSQHKSQWRGALMFYLICAGINGGVNNRYAGDLIRHHAHYDVTLMVGCEGTTQTNEYLLSIGPLENIYSSRNPNCFFKKMHLKMLTESRLFCSWTNKISNSGSANAQLPGCFCPWTFSLNIGLNMFPLDSFMSCLRSLLGYSTGEFQALQLIVLAAFGVGD